MRHVGPSGALAAGLCVAGAAACLAADAVDPHAATGLFRSFNDSKHVIVRSLVEDYSLPLGNDAALSMHWNHERVTVPAVVAAPGTQQAVDAITTASRPIRGNAFQNFAKVRNELQGQVTRGGAAIDYYHSIENDYLAHQLGASYHRDVMDDQLDLSVGTSYGWDDIKPLADDDTQTAADRKSTLHWNAVATRTLTPTTLLRVGLEDNRVDGLQHNPYRRVYAGGTNMPERHPSQRDRRDAFVKLNQYLQNRSSLKLDYRFYTDNWGIVSHESSTRLSQYITHGMFTQYEYRYYTQTAADFYRADYVSTSGVNGYLTGDYRLGPLSSHLLGVTFNVDLGVLAAETPALRRLNVSIDYERYFNNNNYSADILEMGIDLRF